MGDKAVFRLAMACLAVALAATMTGCPNPITPILTNVATSQPGEIVDFKPRPGGEFRALIVHPAEPEAAVVLIPGGDGIAGLDYELGKPVIANKMDFAARNVYRFGEWKAAAALMDVPLDQAGGLTADFRTSPDHRTDIQFMVETMKRRTGRTVWLVGQGDGAVTALWAAEAMKGDVGGLILVSPPTESKALPGGVMGINLAGISVPVLILVHADDTCPASPPEAAMKVRDALVNSPAAVVKTVDQGYFTDPDPCGPKSAHNLSGLDADVFPSIFEFIKAHSR